MNINYLIILIVYVLIMLGIGYWSMRRTKDVGDFFLGGRTLGPWMSAFAFGTTYFSAVLFIGYAGKLGWGFGIHTMWIVLGNTIIGTILSWSILAGRTRDMTVRLNAITMPEFLRTRFDSKTLQVISGLVVFVFLVPYSASVLMGLSWLFSMTLNVDYNHALYILTGLTAVYLLMGGYFAVAISDFVRGIVEFGGVMLMVYLLASKVGGFSHSATVLISDPKAAPGLLAPANLGAGGPLHIVLPGAMILISLVLITSFGPWSLPQMVQKFYSIRSRADVLRATIIAGVFSLFMAFGAYYSGALTHIFYNNKLPVELIAANGKPIYDKVMPHFITTVGLPEVLVVIIVLMVFSASMSSLSSLVLVSSSAIAIDVYGAFVDRHQNQKNTMVLLRVLCVVFVGFSLYIAVQKPLYIVNLMVISWSTLAGVFMAPYIYGLFWKGVTRAGVYAGIFTGLATATILFIAWGEPGIPVAGAITMFLPMLVVPVVSWMTKPPSKEIIALAFGEELEKDPEWKADTTA